MDLVLVPAQSQPNIFGEVEGSISQHLFHLRLLLLTEYAEQVPVEVSAIEQSIRPAQLAFHHRYVPTIHHCLEGGRRNSQFWKMWAVQYMWCKNAAAKTAKLPFYIYMSDILFCGCFHFWYG